MPFLLAEILNFQGSTHRYGVGSFSHIIYPSNLADSIRDAGAGHSLILLTTSFLVIILYRVTLKNKIHTQEPKTVC